MSDRHPVVKLGHRGGEKFTIDALVRMLARVGKQVRLAVQ